MAPAESKQQPRLGIIHLMVGTTCIAVWLAAAQATWHSAPQSETFESALWTAIWSIGGGAALGGPVLFVSRRVRGIRFPIHPGETLLVVLGVNELLRFGVEGAEIVTGADTPWPSTIGFWVQPAAMFGLWLAAAFVTKTRRWRWCFLLFAVLPMLFEDSLVQCLVLVWSPVQFGTFEYPLLFAVRAIVSVATVIIDLRRKESYPWTHWLGVGVMLWQTGFVAAWFVLAWLPAMIP